GFMLARWGRAAEGRAHLELSLANNPSKAIIYRCIGHTYYAERDYVTAGTWYQKAIDLDGQNPLNLTWKARALMAMNDYEGALTVQQEADCLYKSDTSPIIGRYERCRQALKRGKPAFWEQVWEEHKSGASHFYNRAVIQINLGNTNEALDLLTRSFE